MARRRTGSPASGDAQLSVCHPHAAGIDVGSRSHYVAVPPDRDPQPVREFGCYTPDLYAMAAWLQQCGVTTVALESTGVYWMPVFQVLEARGFDVILVNPAHTKHAPGRKTDVEDCQWLQQLHSYGLLSASFRPAFEISVVRAYWRQRDQLVRQASTAIQHMQKALDQMNVHLHKALSDVAGVTGLRIIRAIVDGERNPAVLARMKEPGVRCSEEELLKALTGDYRQEHLFALKLAVEQYDFACRQVEACDTELSAYLATFPDSDRPEPPLPGPGKPKRYGGRHVPGFDLRGELQRITGQDLTALPGMDARTIMTIIAEVGLDMTRWPTEKHFASWLGLCPNRKITGGKVLSSHTRKVANRASAAFRLAAQALWRSQTALGGFYRHIRSKAGGPVAITATAHKLAMLFYRMLRYGHAYLETGAAVFEARHQERHLRNLKKRAKALGFELVETAA